VRVVLMDVPMPLRLCEQDGNIGFDLPDILWLGTETSGEFLSLSDAPRYDKQVDARKILVEIIGGTHIGSVDDLLMLGSWWAGQLRGSCSGAHVVHRSGAVGTGRGK